MISAEDWLGDFAKRRIWRRDVPVDLAGHSPGRIGQPELNLFFANVEEAVGRPVLAGAVLPLLYCLRSLLIQSEA